MTARLIEVWNKIDRLDGAGKARVANLAERDARHPVLVSAMTGEGIERARAGDRGTLGGDAGRRCACRSIRPTGRA